MKKKVLFLSHIPPLPSIGGDRQRISQSLDLLLDNYSVDVALIDNNPSGKSLKELEPRVEKLWEFHPSSMQKLVQASKTLANSLPFAVNLFHHYPLQELVDRIVWNYDFVFAASPVMANYVLKHNVVKYLDMTDSLSMNYANWKNTASWIRRIQLAEEIKRMKRYEQNCLQSFNRTAYISEIDRAFVPHDCRKSIIVSNRVDLPSESDCCRHHIHSRDIIFIGKMDYEPNISAVVHFARNVLPLLNKGNSKPYELKIVGTSPKSIVRSLASDPNVTVTGYVESITDYLRNAHMVVAPMLSGSGVQNKILQAMAHGCCVVTTKIGAEGLNEVLDGLVVCNPDGEEMSAVISSLTNNLSKIRAIGAKGRELISENFGKKLVSRQFSNFIES